MSLLTHLECSRCARHYDSEKLWNLCTECNRPLLARYDLGAARRALNRDALRGREPTMWRYKELLPVKEARHILTLGEGFTPLHRATRLEKELRFERVFIKDEGVNPTGSFKARGLSVAVSRASELGVRRLSIPSAGNAGGAMSAYAALAGMEAFVYMPADVPAPFIVECEATGAHVTLIDGVITDCGRAAAADNKTGERFDVATLKEPYRLEGKKTLGFEIAEQMDWTLPDVVIYPTGGGTGLVGMWKAFDEMEQLGWIDSKRPRMVTVQSDGCAPIVNAFHAGAEFAETWKNPATVADGLRVPSAVGDFLMLRALRESQGTAVAVSDAEMLSGARVMAKTQGIFAAPEGGATVAAFVKLRDGRWIRDGESVVLFNTASGHKSVHLWRPA
jgi:threonine synthase